MKISKIPKEYKGDKHLYVLSHKGNLIIQEAPNCDELKKNLHRHLRYWPWPKCDFLYLFEGVNEDCAAFIRNSLVLLNPFKRKSKLERIVRNFRQSPIPVWTSN